MGLLDLFRRKLQSNEGFRAMMDIPDDETAPRAHHYIFAHQVMPRRVHRYGCDFINFLDPEFSPNWLPRLWEEAGNQVAVEDRILMDGLASFTRRVDDYFIAIVTLPEARSMTEAHLAAIVCGPLPPGTEKLPRRGRKDSPDWIPTQYFTLEYGSCNSGHRTVFCSWTKDGSHHNYGTGPAANAEDFFEFLAHRLTKTGET